MKHAKPASEPLRNSRYSMRLFVTGSTPRSLRAIENIRALCDEELEGSYDLEVIDVYQHRELIGSNEVTVTPTLLKDSPLPACRIVGDLSDKERVRLLLNLVSSGVSARPSEKTYDF